MSLPNTAASCRAPELRAKLDTGAHIEERDAKGRTALFRPLLPPNKRNVPRVDEGDESA